MPRMNPFMNSLAKSLLEIHDQLVTSGCTIGIGRKDSVIPTDLTTILTHVSIHPRGRTEHDLTIFLEVLDDLEQVKHYP